MESICICLCRNLSDHPITCILHCLQVLKPVSFQMFLDGRKHEEVCRSKVRRIRWVGQLRHANSLEELLCQHRTIGGGIVMVQENGSLMSGHPQSMPPPPDCSTQIAQDLHVNLGIDMLLDKFSVHQSVSVKEKDKEHFGGIPFLPWFLRAVGISRQPLHGGNLGLGVIGEDVGFISCDDPVSKSRLPPQLQPMSACVETHSSLSWIQNMRHKLCTFLFQSQILCDNLLSSHSVCAQILGKIAQSHSPVILNHLPSLCSAGRSPGSAGAALSWSVCDAVVSVVLEASYPSSACPF